jgi:ElaA protein
VNWIWSRFEGLGVDALYDALQLRARVFILEQGPYLDPDGADRQAWHLLGRNAAGAARAYLRVVDAGVKFDEVSIGRVVVAAESRGTGLGRVLMSEGLRRSAQVWPGQPVRIGAQAHLQHFYASLGFVTVSAEYLEDGIAHVQMLRKACA